MAAKTTVKVSLTNNAAKDDTFSGDSYSWLSEDGSLDGSLNVLGNDPGSATLIGVSDSSPTTSGDLTQKYDEKTVTVGDQEYTIRLAVNADGTIDFDASDLAGQLDVLAEGEVVSVSFYYTAQMANGTYSTAKVTVTITGENDPPTVAADEATYFDTIVYNDFVDVTGQLVGTDADNGAILTYGLADGEDGVSAYGSLTVNADGTWTFVPDDDAINGLKTNESISFEVAVTDEWGATGTNTLTIYLNGANDAADITGDGTGSITEDAVPDTVSGDLDSTDVDAADADDAWIAVTTPTPSEEGYGTFTISVDGNWTYSLDNDNPAIQALNSGEPLTDTFTVSTADGTTKTVTINITGANDPPTVASVEDTINDTDATDDFLNLTGTLQGSDVDTGAVLKYGLAPGETGVSAYGTLNVAENGDWTFTPNDAAINGLTSETSVSFDVAVNDEWGATGTNTLTINLKGVNDTAIISGKDTGSVTEDMAPNTATGDLNSSDVDNGENDAWTEVTTATASMNGYGTFTISAAGVWTYTLDNSNATVQALNANSEPLTDTFEVSTIDGTTTTITVTIKGADEPITATQQTGTPQSTTFTDGGLNQSWNFSFTIPETSDPDAFDFAGTLTITGVGDFSHTNETITFVGEGENLIIGQTTSLSTGDTGTYTVSDSITLTDLDFQDGVISGTVTLANAVNYGSVTVGLTYDYWV